MALNNMDLEQSNNNFEVCDNEIEYTDLEAITQEASKTLVIHPGSMHLRIGRASDAHPVVIPHVIAWRQKLKKNQPSKMHFLRQNLVLNDQELEKLNDVLFEYSDNHNNLLKEVCTNNVNSKPEKLADGCGWTWSDTSQSPEFLISDDALYIDENDCYNLFWPIVHGKLNVKLHSLTAVIANLKAIWSKAIENFLGIASFEIWKYRCILIVPDIYERNHVKHILDMLFKEMKFSSIIVHQESVCSTYGCGLANACVVDVGHQKTAVCCVEDGFSHSSTRICMDLGGSDITCSLACLLRKICFPYHGCNIKDRMDALLLEELKELFCHLDMDRVAPEMHEFCLRRPNQVSLLYPITLGNEALQAPMSLFFPKIFNLNDELKYVHFAMPNIGDFSDPFDETYLFATRTKQEETWAAKREKVSSVCKFEEENDIDVSLVEDMDSRSSKSRFPTGLLGIDQAIVWSIENCPDSYEDELKRRMYNCILVVGGGLANYSGAEAFIKRRVISAMSINSSHEKFQVNVVIKPKGQDSSSLAWKGGTVLSSLDNAQELWIKRDEWNKYGLRILRENCPFLW